MDRNAYFHLQRAVSPNLPKSYRIGRTTSSSESGLYHIKNRITKHLVLLICCLKIITSERNNTDSVYYSKFIMFFFLIWKLELSCIK